MKSDTNGHRLDAQVLDPGGHLEHTILKPMCHLDGVRKRELLHPGGIAVELQPARDPCRPGVGADLQDAPLVRGAEKSMNRVLSTHVPQAHVERVSTAVGVERLLVEPVCPWRQEGDSHAAPASFERLGRVVQKAEDIVPLDKHFDREVAGRWNDGHGCGAAGIMEPHDASVL